MVNFTSLGYCNRTLELETVDDEADLWKGLKFHHIGLIASVTFSAIAIVISLALIFQHATHYLKPWEQKHIIRILFMVPIYAAVSFLSYLYYLHAIYFQVIQECYEAFAIASFFALMCHYVAPDLHSQKDFFRTLKPKAWVFPLSWCRNWWGPDRGKYFFRTPRSGLTWFNIIWFCVFQYCFIRVFMTIVAVISQAFDRYCEDSLSPAFAHVWVTAIEACAVTVAMVGIIQFYVQLRQDLAEHRPFLKVIAIKLVIFLSFWQALAIDLLVSNNIIQPSKTMAYPDIKIGIPSLLVCIEMALFAVLHLWAYPWKVYSITHSNVVAAESNPSFRPSKSEYKGGAFGHKAILDAMNPWDLIKAIGRGFRWMAVGRKTREQDISYKPHLQSTALVDSVGGKPKKYHPLGDDDEGLERLNQSFASYPQRNRADTTPFTHPDGSVSDLGARESYSSTPIYKDMRTGTPAMPDIREDGGGHNPQRPSEADTAYYGAHDTAYALPHAITEPRPTMQSHYTDHNSQPHALSPRHDEAPPPPTHGVAYGGPQEVEMPDAGSWAHAK